MCGLLYCINRVYLYNIHTLRINMHMGSVYSYIMILHIYCIYTLKNLHVSWLIRAMTITKEWGRYGKKTCQFVSQLYLLLDGLKFPLILCFGSAYVFIYFYHLTDKVLFIECWLNNISCIFNLQLKERLRRSYTHNFICHTVLQQNSLVFRSSGQSYWTLYCSHCAQRRHTFIVYVKPVLCNLELL